MTDVAGDAFVPIQKSAVTGQAVDRIKEVILSGRFPPGSKLPPERELSAALGISRSSVREAIRALSHMNIVEARHGQGTYVTSLSPELLIAPLRFVLAVDDKTIYELFEVRKIVESGAARLAAGRASDAEVEELRGRQRALAAAVEDADVFLDEDVILHELVAVAAGNDLLVSLLGSVSTLLRESRRRTVSHRSIRDATVRDHAEIVRAIEARDPDAAAAAMRAHLDHVEAGLRALRHPGDELQTTTQEGD